MPKKIFWPATLVVMGFILLTSNFKMIPTVFWNLWPIILIVVGLGGLLTADREEWLCEVKKPAKVGHVAKKTPAKASTSKKKKK